MPGGAPSPVGTGGRGDSRSSDSAGRGPPAAAAAARAGRRASLPPSVPRVPPLAAAQAETTPCAGGGLVQGPPRALLHRWCSCAPGGLGTRGAVVTPAPALRRARGPPAEPGRTAGIGGPPGRPRGRAANRWGAGRTRRAGGPSAHPWPGAGPRSAGAAGATRRSSASACTMRPWRGSEGVSATSTERSGGRACALPPQVLAGTRRLLSVAAGGTGR